jgi:hypothetical protein
MVEIAPQIVIVAFAVLFLGFLLLKMRPLRVQRRMPIEVRRARERARMAGTPRARAEALCDAAVLSARKAGRWTAAAGLFLRAMRADPTWAGPVQLAIRTLHKRRPRLLETMLWRRLAQLPWDEPHREAVHAAGTGLKALYRHELRDSAKARFLRRFVRAVAP